MQQSGAYREWESASLRIAFWVVAATQQTRQCGAHMGFTWATGVQSGHGLKMGILSGPHLGDPARTHMGEPRWAPHVVPTWVINGKCVHGLKMGYIWDPICFMKYTSANIINPI